MNEQMSDRVGALETDVAVMQSNYVRRDEFADLRTEVRVGFAQVDAQFGRTDAKIDRATSTLLKWMFASQLSVAALVVAAIKYF
ncbi:conserved hypothetical protein [Ricinus communis]|uniref:DUF1640 domain-containing protein n=1 Tax=Ricinus communis TaxID=3988 RepID=B9TAB0_RICCO|nr:conserved hypothetical protein [Ricinus communis]